MGSLLHVFYLFVRKSFTAKYEYEYSYAGLALCSWAYEC
jgi:hypothetical protein